MLFYNPETNDTLSKKDLSLKYNACLPKSIKEYKGYYSVIEDTKPLATSYQTLVENPIKFVDGVYKKSYTLMYKSIDEIRKIILKDISDKFSASEKTAFIKSSYGFFINANETANRDIDGLIKRMKVKSIESELFRDYNNNFHNLTLEQLETLQLEIIENAQSLYKQKWNFMNYVETVDNLEDLLNYKIEFKNMEF